MSVQALLPNATGILMMLRPQPLGVFAGPQGALLLPRVEGAENALFDSLRGRLDQLPQAWRFYRLALEDCDAALVALSSDNSLEARYNRFVLEPRPEAYAELQASLTGEWRGLLEAVAFQAGLRSTPPNPDHLDAVDYTGEIRAYLLATYAGYLLEQNQVEAALTLLEAAARLVKDLSPAFAARLYGEWARLEAAQGSNSDKGLGYLERAIELYAQTAFKIPLGELWLQLGIALQTRAEGRDKSLLLRAVHAYQEASQILRPEQAPEAFGIAQMNLALAYLIMPMNEEAERLRYAIAATSLRESLKIFQPDTHPELWASATLNLANLLQHANTAHPEENLWEAVALYEDVLKVRRPDTDSIAYARVLANQGNALAHLGAFSRAVPRLLQARALFEQAGETDSVAAIEEVLAEVERCRGLGRVAKEP